MLSLNWTDWIGLCVLAFGLVAGFRRGLTHQFIRLLILLAALAGAGALAALLGFQEPDPEAAQQAAGGDVWKQLGLFGLLWLVGSYVHKSFILPRLSAEKKKGLGIELGGALAGLACAVILHGVVVSAAFWTQGRPGIETARGAPLARNTVSFLGYAPAPPRPAFLDLSLLDLIPPDAVPSTAEAGDGG